MSISNQILIIAETVILPFAIKIAHAVQVFNITKSVIDLVWFTTVSTIIVAHLDDIFRIAVTIADPMVIWAAVLAIIATDFIEIDQVTFAIIN